MVECALWPRRVLYLNKQLFPYQSIRTADAVSFQEKTQGDVQLQRETLIILRATLYTRMYEKSDAKQDVSRVYKLDVPCKGHHIRAGKL